MQPVYLDYNSTTPIDHEVAAEIGRVYSLQLANPASQHQLGQAARKMLEEFKTEIVQYLGGRAEGVDSDRLVVTSGGTESNNLALVGLATAERRRRNAEVVVISAIEHPSIVAAAQRLEQLGFVVNKLPVDRTGMIDVSALPQFIDERTAVVSVMLANHETGVIQPVEPVAERCHQYSVPIHSDASQAIGKMEVRFDQLGVDAITISPHKFHGPRSVGGLLVRGRLEFDPLLVGGEQQLASRPGTEDIALVAGFRLALFKSIRGLPEFAKLAALRDQLEQAFLAGLASVQIHGGQSPRLPNTSNLVFPNVNRQALLMAADLAGICFSTGSACASGSSEPSPVLTAMGLSRELVDSSIRLSLGRETEATEIERAGREILAIARRLHG